MLKIKDIPINERPRERLINYGPSSLSNEDLLAIILKCGSKKMSAKLLATNIISKLSNIENIKELSYEMLISFDGIGPAKATELLAAIELGKRLNQKNHSLRNIKFNNSKLVYDYYSGILGDKKQEYFYAVYLDSNKTIIKDKKLFIGTLNQSIVHPREIFKEACMVSASSIICVHNHPSNNILPSKEDKLLTDNLQNIGKQMGIPIIDHIIIGKNNYYSFFENGDIWLLRKVKIYYNIIGEMICIRGRKR